jgi:hypothetical protein
MNELEQSAMQKILARAAEDRAFRKLLLTDARAAIRQITNAPVPQKLRIKFIEKHPDADTMVVLPDLITEEGELSEEDVATVAGGTNWGCADVSTE